ncbi:SET domain protein [Aspergillus ambiguus]|uniref:SET domain-containing protein n=1 Tax=Aspergillus ambiguus TaxID=176160 RepID=UPI003CCDD142
MKRDNLPIESLSLWTKLNNISVDGVAFKKVQGGDGIEKGSAIIATADIPKASSTSDSADLGALIKVPADMVLSQQLVENHAKADQYLRDVLEAVGDFGRTARGAILIFLILQFTHSCDELPKSQHNVGVSHPWAEYLKFMPPSVLLPTLYDNEEADLLCGTSIRVAVEAKKSSMEREFEHLRQSTEEIPWCQKLWWGESGKLTLDDWKYADALYRSRSVDLPRSGHAMVPCVDMANHSSEDTMKAVYEEDSTGNAVLQLWNDRVLHPGDEVTISYGSDKPASEFLFAYGFLPEEMKVTTRLFLDLEIPDDDPLRLPKADFCKDPPGAWISHSTTRPGRSTSWNSPFVWWACVNEEDGLRITLVENGDGGRETRVYFNEQEVKDSNHLRDLLAAHPLWDIIHLRAVMLVLAQLNLRVYNLRRIQAVAEQIDQDADMRAHFRAEVRSETKKLRDLEDDLLAKAMSDMEKERDELLASQTVKSYLSDQTGAEDFS